MMRLPVAVVRSLQALWGAALVGACVSIPAVPARAEATVFRFANTHTETFTARLEGCLPQDLAGTWTLTETSTGQVVETGGGVFSVRGLNEYDARTTFPDGSYVQSGLNRDRYVFIADPPHTVYNLVGQDLRTIFAADGTPIGTVSIHAGFHVTYTDVNGNGAPDPGEIASTFDYFHLRCG